MKDYKILLSLLSIAIITLSLALPKPGIAATLSQEEAKRLLIDTSTIATYLTLKGESDYANKPDNIIKAALFGAFDAKMEFTFEQEQRKEEGKQTQSDTTAMFTVNGQPVTADQVLMREEAPEIFKNLSEKFTCFVSKEAVALAALHFTGHSIKNHKAPKGDEVLGDTLLNDKGYFVSIEGLGDAPTEAVLKSVSPQGDGFVLRGEVVEVMGDPEEMEKPGKFCLELKPGDVPGTWKRQYSEIGVAN